jgi:DNA-binding CsgD family transcriptional regulator
MLIVIIGRDVPDLERYLEVRRKMTSEGQELSLRELEIVSMLSHGLSQVEVAKRLFLSLSTIKGHLVNARKKLRARNTVNLVAIAKVRKLV